MYYVGIPVALIGAYLCWAGFNTHGLNTALEGLGFLLIGLTSAPYWLHRT